MSNIIKYIVLLVVVVSGSVNADRCSDEVSIAEELISEKDTYYMLLSSIIDSDKQGIHKKNPEVSFRDIEKAYSRVGVIVENCPKNIKYIKLMMMFAFYASERNNGGINEYLAQGMLFAYHRSPESFLSAMKEMPFALISTCLQLNNNFDLGWADTPYSKSEFKRHFYGVAVKKIGMDKTKLCLASIK